MPSNKKGDSSRKGGRPNGPPPGGRVRPHYEKLKELLENPKLPAPDRSREESALVRYGEWVSKMDRLGGEGENRVTELVKLLNDYKTLIELDLVWDSSEDFLYRQRGQLKLDGSILEEFLPRLVDPRIIPSLEGVEYVAGPQSAFCDAYFTTSLGRPQPGAGFQIRTKNHDFAVARAIYLRASLEENFPPEQTVSHSTYLAFVAAECKTNLDKTMFQEAAATAHDLKMAVPGARYYLVCEWLDMAPISASTTDIDEVLILRGKRLPSNRRERYAASASRRLERDWYSHFLATCPVRADLVLRFVHHLNDLFANVGLDEEEVVERVWF